MPVCAACFRQSLRASPFPPSQEAWSGNLPDGPSGLSRKSPQSSLRSPCTNVFMHTVAIRAIRVPSSAVAGLVICPSRVAAAAAASQITVDALAITCLPAGFPLAILRRRSDRGNSNSVQPETHLNTTNQDLASVQSDRASRSTSSAVIDRRASAGRNRRSPVSVCGRPSGNRAMPRIFRHDFRHSS